MYNWLNSENVKIEGQDHPIYMHVKNNPIQEISSFMVDGTSDDFDFLVSNKFLVTSQEESRNETRKIYAELTSTQNLNLILMPAEQHCNFKCVYCYQDRNKRNIWVLRNSKF